MTDIAIVCGNGCVGVAGAGCKCGTPSQIYSSGSLGTFKDRSIMVAMQRRKGAVTTADGITVAPTGTPMQVEIMSDTRYAATPLDIQITADFALGAKETITLQTKRPVRGPSGTVVAVEVVSYTSPKTQRLLDLAWTYVGFTVARSAPAVQHYTGCTHRRRTRCATVSPAPNIVWGKLGQHEAETVLPPGYTRSATGVACVWCQKHFGTKQAYVSECAQDLGA